MSSYTVHSYSEPASDLAIDARELVKAFGDKRPDELPAEGTRDESTGAKRGGRRSGKRALDNFELQLGTGRICGLLGPNGAGKTTAVRILTTLLRADSGFARVAGFDAITQAHEVRARIGLSGQSPAVDEILSGRQNLVLFGRLNGLSKRAAGERADELLTYFDLQEAADKPIKQYSGGMRRRADLAVTLLLAPTVLFLDEPTTGLDPRNRNEVWGAIRTLVARGTSVLLTTQYLEEADQLADDIVVMDQGRVVSAGSPAALKAQVGSDRVNVTFADADALQRARAVLSADATVTEESHQLHIAVDDRVDGLSTILSTLAGAGIRPVDIEVHEPSLDDVFLTLTGRPAVDAAATEEQ
jgi:ABC-2 type transport system ATP-binding protein